MKKTILILIFLNHLLYSQIPQNMVVPLIYPPTGQLINQDSAIAFDTSGVRYPSTNNDSVFWDNTFWCNYPEARGKVYAKYYWDVRFAVPAIVLDSVRGDTLIFVTYNAIPFSQLLQLTAIPQV